MDSFDINKIAHLIDALYTEKDPHTITTIQSYLQNYQKSQYGIQIADLLLSEGNSSLNCRFFGALTYTVQLNLLKNSTEIDKDVSQILHNLMGYSSIYIQQFKQGNGNNLFIIKKLFSNESLIYNTFFNSVNQNQWFNPLLSLLKILAGSDISIDNLESTLSEADLNSFLQNTQNTSLQLILDFSSIIIEDLLKIGKDARRDTHHQIVQIHLYSTTKSVLIYIFKHSEVSLKLKALECLQTWIQYISFAENNTSARYRDINELLRFPIDLLNDKEESVVAASVDLLIDLFQNNPLLMSSEQRESLNSLLFSEWSLRHINNLMNREDYYALNNFADLIICFMEINLLQWASQILRKENEHVLQLLLNLTNFPLVPILEETISRSFVEFWSQVVEIFIEDSDALAPVLKNDEQRINEIKINSDSLFRELSTIYFNKIQYKNFDQSSLVAVEDEFASFRLDVSDIFDLIYSKLGPALFQSLVSNINDSSDIDEIETSLFILSALSLNFNSNDVDEIIINSTLELFRSNFLLKIGDFESSDSSFNEYYIKTTIKFLGAIEFFYKSDIGTDYLNSIVNYLFRCLKDFPTHQFIIARTILEICDNCRTKLIGSITTFEPLLVEMITNPLINPFTRGKFINSISCIIQSIEEPAAQENHVYHMIELIIITAQPLLAKASTNSLEEKELEYLISLFGCIHEIGKGLRIPNDEEEDDDIPKRQSFLKFYNGNNNHKVQTKVNQIVALFAIEIPSLSTNADIGEKACLIYKVGLLEDYGPFSFKYEDVIEFAIAKAKHCNITKTYPYILELLTTLVNTGFNATNRQLLTQENIQIIVQAIIIEKLDIITQDPDILLSAIDLITAIVLKKPNFLIYDPIFELVIKLCLDVLKTKEKMVVKSISKFWVALLTTKKVSKQDSEFLRKLIEEKIGAILTYSTFSSLIDLPRSDVEFFAGIIVHLIGKYQLFFKIWVTESLYKINEKRISSNQRPLDQPDIFVKKLLITRGSSRKCVELIKDFWIVTNGMISYSSKKY